MEEEKVHMVIEDLNHYIPQQYQVEEEEIQGNNSDLEPPEILVLNNESSDEEDGEIALNSSEIEEEWSLIDENEFQNWKPKWIKPFEENSGPQLGTNYYFAQLI